MVTTDQWSIAEQDLHGAGYKTLVCCPENALTGASAQKEGLIAVPFPHVLRRAYAWYTSTDTTAGVDALSLFKASIGGTFALVGLNVAVVPVGDTGVRVLEIGLLENPIDQEEESADVGALYQLELDILTGTDVFDNVGFGIMVTPIPPGPYEHRQ